MFQRLTKKRKSAKFNKQEKARLANQKSKKENKFLIFEIVKIVKEHFPDFFEKLKGVNDPRKQAQYGVDEIVFGAISMFLFKTGSRNNYDNFRKCGKFAKNFTKAFGLRLASMDAVADVIKELPQAELETIKKLLVKRLIEKRVFDKHRFQSKVLIAIDGTGIATYKHKHCEECLHTTSKNGIITYYHKVLEAKIVTKNGFSISICTEWIDNKDTNSGIYDKQGCETKAFTKLSGKLKSDFPRLNICICADGLYPKNSFFEICTKNNWDWIVTLKDGNLKGLWKKISLVNRDSRKVHTQENKGTVVQNIQWINDIEHNGYSHNWIQCKEKVTDKSGKITHARFVHLTSFLVNYENSVYLSKSGRLRWNIEQQGFDQQKNHGYSIEHKYCRKSYLGLKNFYQCCQIAHLINQLVELNKDYKAKLCSKMTTMFMWELMRAFLIFGYISSVEIQAIKSHKSQIQYPSPD